MQGFDFLNISYLFRLATSKIHGKTSTNIAYFSIFIVYLHVATVSLSRGALFGVEKSLKGTRYMIACIWCNILIIYNMYL